MEKNLPHDQDYLDQLDESEQVALKEKMFKAIKLRISQKEAEQSQKKAIWKKAKIAASLSLLLAATFSAWVWTGKVDMVYHTAENEILEIVLPDSSAVTLNSNSTLSYQLSRFSGFDRKVKLEGEAFFSIRKDPEGKTFEVNRETELGVTVLGTEFSIKKAASVNKVTLIEGSVLLDYVGKAGNTDHLMTPGESVKLDSEKKELKSKQSKNPEKLISWKFRKLEMENEHLEEVVKTLTEIYDLTLDETSNLQSKAAVSGSLPLSDRPEEVLENLEILFNASIELNGDTLSVNKINKAEYKK